MLSTTSFHKVLFFLSLLFGLETPLVSSETEVHIDREVKTGRISYHGIRAPKGKAEELGSLLRALKDRKRFGEGLKGIELSMIMFRSHERELTVEVFFTYEEEQRMCKALGLERKEEGGIAFGIREREDLLKTNGDSSATRTGWGEEARKLHFRLGGEPLDEKERKGMRILNYVED